LKSKLNIWLLVSFLIAAALSLWLYFKQTTKVGDIFYDSAMDSAEFNSCGDYQILQYYQVGTYYQSGKKAIKTELLPKVKTDGLPQNGLLTVRFVVNCNGETGYFRTKMIDANIKEIEVPLEASKPIYALIAELKGWVPGQIYGNPTDSYAQIAFKLEDGKITDIF